jgi:serine/threonine protein kinase
MQAIVKLVINTEVNRTDIVTPIPAGQILADRYEILSHLGTGGMATVYKARDLLADQLIAIKVVLPVVSREVRLREKLKQELLVARKLTHPNIVRIYDIGEHQGLLFISMELIEGLTVDEILRERKRFSVEEFLALFDQFTSALSYIHSQQVLHRDIKPQNLMYDSDWNLKVMDFGIARDMASVPATQSTRMGTPAYMSPELLKGAPLTPTSDIYSAGIMFFELLTGARPFRKGSLHERMNKRLPRLSKIIRDIPPDLDQMVYRCLQFRSEDRFQSVDELIAAISPRHNSVVPSTGTLSDLLQTDPPALTDVLPLFVRIVRQLAAVHGDKSCRPILTPQNIFWSPEDVQIKTSPAAQAQHTRAIDSKYTSFEGFDESALTGAQQVQSDIYILGFIYYEILLGRKLFEAQFGDFDQRDSGFRWLSWHCDPAKAAISLKEVLRECPSKLSDTIQSMMQKVPGAKPDLATVEASLETVLKELSRQDNAAADTVRLKRRRSWTTTRQRLAATGRLVKKVMLISAATVILIGILTAGGWLLRRVWQLASSPAASPDVLPTTSARPATTPQPQTALPQTVDSGTGLMVLVPEAEFQMGNDDGPVNADSNYESEAPRHSVRLPAFYIDKYEVTNRFYKEFCDSTGRKYPQNPTWDSSYFEKPDYPVMNVSWYDAQAYAQWAGKRLPTEAEWEFSARGTNGNLFPWGQDFQEGAANIAGSADGYKYTAPVGSVTLDASPFGVMDMAGNVAEWVENLYTLYPGNPGRLPSNEQGQRVVRGSGMAFGPESARLTSRMPRAPTGRWIGIGFRCSVDVQMIMNAVAKKPK